MQRIQQGAVSGPIAESQTILAFARLLRRPAIQCIPQWMAALAPISEPAQQMPSVEAQGSYAVATMREGIVWTAGQLSRTGNGVLAGTARGEGDLDRARRACAIAALRAIAAVRSVADLDQVDRVLSLRGFIAARPSFTLHSRALDAAFEILLLAFGPAAGRHARSATGASSLPGGGLAEVELVVGLKPARAAPSSRASSARRR